MGIDPDDFEIEDLEEMDRPDCGHSACVQNWIDTGEGDCVFEDEEDDDA